MSIHTSSPTIITPSYCATGKSPRQYGDKVYLYSDLYQCQESIIFNVYEMPVLLNAYNITCTDTKFKLFYIFNEECGSFNSAAAMSCYGCQMELNSCIPRLVLTDPGQYRLVAYGRIGGVVVTYREAPLLKEIGRVALENCCSCTDPIDDPAPS